MSSLVDSLLNPILLSKMKLNIAPQIGSVLFGITAFSSLASAQVQIDGVIQMGPSGAPNLQSGLILGDAGGNVTTDLSSAVTIDSWINSVVDAVSGDFPGALVGNSVTYFNGWTIGVPQANLWSVGGFSFDLQSAIVDFYPANPSFPGSVDFLTVEGFGVLNGPVGFSPTSGTWNFSTQGTGTPLFSWSSSTSSVPDGGATVALLGCSLLGLHGLRRKLAKK